MHINKIVIIPFKKNAIGNSVYICKYHNDSGEVFFLPNTASSGLEDYTKLEAFKFLKDFGFVYKNITIDLGILIYNKISFKCYAMLVDDNQDLKLLPSYAKDSAFESLNKATKKCSSPFKDFLEKFSNWQVV